MTETTENRPLDLTRNESDAPLTVTRPAAGETQIVQAEPGQTYLLNFAVENVAAQMDGTDLVLAFVSDNGETADSELVFEDLGALPEGSESPTFLIGETVVDADALIEQILALSGEAAAPLETAAELAAQGSGGSEYNDDLGNIIDLLTAQDVIDPVELSFSLDAVEFLEPEAVPEEGDAPPIVINEIGLDTVVFFNFVQGGDQFSFEGSANFVEFYNTGGSTQTDGLTVEFLNPAGIVVSLEIPAGFTIPDGGFLTLYQDADADMGGSPTVYGVLYNAAGVSVGGFILPGATPWALGDSTAEALAVNLVYDLGGAEQISIDSFAANLEQADLAVLTDAVWTGSPAGSGLIDLLFDTFNGSLTPAHNIFSRVFDDSDPASGAPIDSDTAADWTTNVDATDGEINLNDGLEGNGPLDPNPNDTLHDDLDPQQASDDPLGGQTVQNVEDDNGGLLEGGAGPDFLFGDDGNDTLYGGSAALLELQSNYLLENGQAIPSLGVPDHNDFLFGGAGNDNLYGGAGGDLLIGGQGQDLLDGGTGDDTLYGQDAPLGGIAPGPLGNQTANADVIAGDAINNIDIDDFDAAAGVAHGGDDSVFGGFGGDAITGEALAFSNGAAAAIVLNTTQAVPGEPSGNDLLLGESGIDSIAGDALALGGAEAYASVSNTVGLGDHVGSDSIMGGELADMIAGDAFALSAGLATTEVHNLSVNGTAGDDSIDGGLGADVIAGDTLSLSSNEAYAGVRNTAEGELARSGNDLVNGFTGSDQIAGDAFAIATAGESFAEAAVYNEASGTAVAGSDSIGSLGPVDTRIAGDALAIAPEGQVIATAINATDSGSAGNDSISAGHSDNLIAGDALAEGAVDPEATVENLNAGGMGAAGSDNITAATGNDSIAGDALSRGDSGNATVINTATAGFLARVGSDSIEGGGGDDMISGDALALDGGTAEVTNSDVDVPAGNDSILGGSGADSIAGDAMSDSGSALVAFGGDDTLYGGSGDDVISGDALTFGGGFAHAENAGDDLIFGEDGNDILYGDSNDNTFLGGSDSIDGGSDNDALFGNDGDDSLMGGDGNDTLTGGEGADSLIGGAGEDEFRFGEGDGGLVLNAADLLEDFEDGIDMIGLTGGLTFADLTLSDVGTGVQVEVTATNEILVFVEGIDTTSLDGADFFEVI